MEAADRNTLARPILTSTRTMYVSRAGNHHLSTVAALFQEGQPVPCSETGSYKCLCLPVVISIAIRDRLRSPVDRHKKISLESSKVLLRAKALFLITLHPGVRTHRETNIILRKRSRTPAIDS